MIVKILETVISIILIGFGINTFITQKFYAMGGWAYGVSAVIWGSLSIMVGLFFVLGLSDNKLSKMSNDIKKGSLSSAFSFVWFVSIVLLLSGIVLGISFFVKKERDIMLPALLLIFSILYFLIGVGLRKKSRMAGIIGIVISMAFLIMPLIYNKMLKIALPPILPIVIIIFILIVWRELS